VGATRSPALQDQRIVLIDDVLTSGATAEACSSALLAAGAAEVGVLTFAHVLSPKGAD
jgi:predicted amidophosphoribosyltransferase